jgi:uncharacterized protein
MTGELSAIPFAAWLRRFEAALAEEQPADVPCADCNACCRTSHFIHVRPEEKRALRAIPRGLLSPAPGLPPGNLVIGYDETGRCGLLVDGRCSIYEVRPLACRTYDCRVYLAAGMAADRPAISGQVERWRFTHPTADDRDRHEAVREAARYIREHPGCLATDAARRDPLRVAILAVAVHESFLPGASASGGEGSSGWSSRERSDRALARAVVSAHERLFGDC